MIVIGPSQIMPWMTFSLRKLYVKKKNSEILLFMLNTQVNNNLA